MKRSGAVRTWQVLGDASRRYPWRSALVVSGLVGIVYMVLAGRHYFDQLNYTFVIAEAFLHGHVSVSERPEWLNELVSVGDRFVSVFPLGAILTMLPFAAMKYAGLTADFPAGLVVGLLGAVSVLASFGITLLRNDWSLSKRLVFGVWIALATWLGPNLVFAGAWQIAVGWAVVGQLGAIYFSLVRPRPIMAGACLALAFGNRTEVLLTAPIILWWLLRVNEGEGARHKPGRIWTRYRAVVATFATRWPEIVKFTLIPVALGAATLVYNWVRFGIAIDFGYARIDGVLLEPWYAHGIFSLYAIPDNARVMLWHGWQVLSSWPYIRPDPFGSNIWFGAPLIGLLLWRWHRGRAWVIWPSVIAVGLITLSLWLHGNTGGWQMSYRYGAEILPWLLVLLIERLPGKLQWYEVGLWLAGCALNGWGLYLFFTTAMGY